MRTVNSTEARKNLSSLLDEVIDDADEVVITRAGKEPAILVGLAEYNSLKETDYLLRNPANAEFLRRSIAQADAGKAIERELTDPDSVVAEGVA